MSAIVLDTLHRDRTSWDEIKANLPQNETHDLIVSLRSMSQGTGFFTWTYDHLQEVLTQARRNPGRPVARRSGLTVGREESREARLPATSSRM